MVASASQVVVSVAVSESEEAGDCERGEGGHGGWEGRCGTVGWVPRWMYGLRMKSGGAGDERMTCTEAFNGKHVEGSMAEQTDLNRGCSEAARRHTQGGL